MKKIIPRQKYFKLIEPYITKDLIKVLVGQRRVGKSYLLQQIIDYIKKNFKDANIIYINKDLYDFDKINNYDDLYNYVKTNSVKEKLNFLFIDEIQTIEKFELALRSLIAEGGYDIYCTGSNSKLLSSELSTYLSGRYIEINVFPLTYTEFLIFHNLESTSDAVNKYLKYGGMPYLKNLKLTDEVVFDYLSNIYQAIILRDVVARYNIRNVDFLDRLVLFLSKNIGSVFSARNIATYLKGQNINLAVSTILDYIKYLSSAFFVHSVSRIDLIGKQVFEVGEKIFFNDIGLRNSLAGFSIFEIGKILENVVFNHLLYNNYKVYVGKFKDYEIDFVAEKNGERYYFQVAYQISEFDTEQREFGNLLKIKDNFPKYVITLDSYNGVSYKGVKHLSLKKFLESFS